MAGFSSFQGQIPERAQERSREQIGPRLAQDWSTPGASQSAGTTTHKAAKSGASSLMFGSIATMRNRC